MKQNKKIKKRIVLIILTLVIILGGSSYYFYFQRNQSKDEDTLWREYPVSKGNITSYFESVGKLEFEQDTYDREYWMMVKEVYVKEGQEVKKDQELLKDSYGNIIYAKTDGVVIKLFAEKNKAIEYKKPIITIGNYEQKFLKIKVKQEEINSVSIGQKIKFNFMSEGESELEAEVTEINMLPKDSQDSIEYEVTAKLSPTDIHLLSGMTGSAKFIEKSVENVLVLSNKGIELKDGKQFVLVRDKNKEVKRIEIKTGFSDGRDSEVTEGLKDGDIVVVKG